MASQLPLFCHLFPEKSFHLISVDDDLALLIYVLLLGYSNVMYTGFWSWRNIKWHRTLQRINYLKLVKNFSFSASTNYYVCKPRDSHAMWRPWAAKAFLCSNETKCNKDDDLWERQMIRFMNELLSKEYHEFHQLPFHGPGTLGPISWTCLPYIITFRTEIRTHFSTIETTGSEIAARVDGERIQNYF